MIYCPVCKSSDIFPVAGGYIGQIYVCKKLPVPCTFVLETDDKSDELKEA
jgi:transposase-like protein